MRAGTGVVLRARLVVASDASLEAAGRFAFEAGAGGVCARGTELVGTSALHLSFTASANLRARSLRNRFCAPVISLPRPTWSFKWSNSIGRRRRSSRRGSTTLVYISLVSCTSALRGGVASKSHVARISRPWTRFVKDARYAGVPNCIIRWMTLSRSCGDVGRNTKVGCELSDNSVTKALAASFGLFSIKFAVIK